MLAMIAIQQASMKGQSDPWGAGILSQISCAVSGCRRFLNRLLGLPVSQQNLLFSYFEKTLVAEIRAAKAEGRYFEGVSDLSGSNISERPQPQVQLLVFSRSSVFPADMIVWRSRAGWIIS